MFLLHESLSKLSYSKKDTSHCIGIQRQDLIVPLTKCPKTVTSEILECKILTPIGEDSLIHRDTGYVYIKKDHSLCASRR